MADNNRDELKKKHNVDIRIKEMCLKNNILNSYQLQQAAGIAPSVAQNLFNERFTEISLKVLEKVCNALGCQPSELFKVTLDKKFFDKVAETAKVKAKKRKDKKALAEADKVTPMEGVIADTENAPATDIENEAVETELSPEETATATGETWDSEEFNKAMTEDEPELTLEEQARAVLTYEDNEETA